MTETTGSVPSGGVEPDHFSRYVVRTFPQALRGYSRADVDAHLRQVRGWFSLAGFEQLLADRRNEILGSALRDAEATIEEARRTAEAMIDQARREAQTIVDESARRAAATTAAAERRIEALRSLAAAILDEVEAQS